MRRTVACSKNTVDELTRRKTDGEVYVPEAAGADYYGRQLHCAHT
jgi:hypothetical protein